MIKNNEKEAHDYKDNGTPPSPARKYRRLEPIWPRSPRHSPSARPLRDHPSLDRPLSSFYTNRQHPTPRHQPQRPQREERLPPLPAGRHAHAANHHHHHHRANNNNSPPSRPVGHSRIRAARVELQRSPLAARSRQPYYDDRRIVTIRGEWSTDRLPPPRRRHDEFQRPRDRDRDRFRDRGSHSGQSPVHNQHQSHHPHHGTPRHDRREITISHTSPPRASPRERRNSDRYSSAERHRIALHSRPSLLSENTPATPALLQHQPNSGLNKSASLPVEIPLAKPTSEKAPSLPSTRVEADLRSAGSSSHTIVDPSNAPETDVEALQKKRFKAGCESLLFPEIGGTSPISVNVQIASPGGVGRVMARFESKSIELLRLRLGMSDADIQARIPVTRNATLDEALRPPFLRTFTTSHFDYERYTQLLLRACGFTRPSISVATTPTGAATNAASSRRAGLRMLFPAELVNYYLDGAKVTEGHDLRYQPINKRFDFISRSLLWCLRPATTSCSRVCRTSSNGSKGGDSKRSENPSERSTELNADVMNVWLLLMQDWCNLLQRTIADLVAKNPEAFDLKRESSTSEGELKSEAAEVKKENVKKEVKEEKNRTMEQSTISKQPPATSVPGPGVQKGTTDHGDVVCGSSAGGSSNVEPIVQLNDSSDQSRDGVVEVVLEDSSVETEDYNAPDDASADAPATEPEAPTTALPPSALQNTEDPLQCIASPDTSRIMEDLFAQYESDAAASQTVSPTSPPRSPLLRLPTTQTESTPSSALKDTSETATTHEPAAQINPMPTTLYLSTDFMTTFEQGLAPCSVPGGSKSLLDAVVKTEPKTSFNACCEKIFRFFRRRKWNLWNYRFICWPINYIGAHWLLLTVDTKERELIWSDSYWRWYSAAAHELSKQRGKKPTADTSTARVKEEDAGRKAAAGDEVGDKIVNPLLYNGWLYFHCLEEYLKFDFYKRVREGWVPPEHLESLPESWKKQPWRRVIIENLPQQDKLSLDCGVFVAQFARCIGQFGSATVLDFTDNDINELREQMAVLIGFGGIPENPGQLWDILEARSPD